MKREHKKERKESSLWSQSLRKKEHKIGRKEQCNEEQINIQEGKERKKQH